MCFISVLNKMFYHLQFAGFFILLITSLIILDCGLSDLFGVFFLFEFTKLLF